MPRFFTPDKLGGRCRYCGERVVRALEAAGYYAHPTCGPWS